MPSAPTNLELACVAALALLAVLVSYRWLGKSRWRGLSAVLLLNSVAIAGLAWQPRAMDASRTMGPKVGATGAYVGSQVCQTCHPGAHASWQASFHSRMTQWASPETVRAPWDEPRLALGERDVRLWRDGKRFMARLPEPGKDPGTAPSVEREIVMTTGSHHYQGYWVAGERKGELRQLPFVYNFEGGRFLPRESIFVQPPGVASHSPRWNSSCIMCHSVAGEPGHDLQTDVFDTRVVELGIACEACHGPGSLHQARQRNPVTRYAAHLSDTADDSIINPARLSAAQASAVCGQCHSYFVPHSTGNWWQVGFSESTPDQPLEQSRRLLVRGQEHAALTAQEIDSIFYADGSVRVGGREYNGLRLSPCFEQGTGRRKLSCLSCHQMHGADPEDQLKQGLRGNQGCLECHTTFIGRVSEHTRHAPESSGSLCYNCHMPYTSYALLKAIRSHRITTPNLSQSETARRPNACNLCHLDRSLTWTNQKLAELFQQPLLALEQSDVELPESARWLLSGDAATRAIAAWHLGSPLAPPQKGDMWRAAILSQALLDPYSAVRFVAVRSLRQLPGHADLQYDFLAPDEASIQSLGRTLSIGSSASRFARLLPDAQGKPSALVRRLVAERDNSPITISE